MLEILVLYLYGVAAVLFFGAGLQNGVPDG